MAVVAVVDASKQKLDALRVQYAEFDSEVTRLHSEVDIVKQVRVEETRLSHGVEKMTVSLNSTVDMRDEPVERADNLSA